MCTRQRAVVLMRELWVDFGWSGFLLSCYYFELFGPFLLSAKKNKLLYYFTGDVFKCVCLCDVSCFFQKPQTEVYGPHKDSVQPHKNQHSNQSATEKSLTNHTQTLKIWPHPPVWLSSSGILYSRKWRVASVYTQAEMRWAFVEFFRRLLREGYG